MLRALAWSDSHFSDGDELATKFLGSSVPGRLARVRRLRPMLAWISEQVSPGSYFFEIGRGRYMDAVLVQELQRGARDVVLLGAGYDSRAYRFAARFPDVRFWEVDQPSMITGKQKKVRAALGRLPDTVGYVAVDFERDDLVQALRAAGLPRDAYTVWIWSGVSYYLSPPAVDAVFDVVRSSAAGSALVFDYLFRAAISGLDDFYGLARTREYIRRQGEPWRFGLDPQDLTRFLQDRGFELISACDPAELRVRHLLSTEGRPHGRPLGFFGLCHARMLEEDGCSQPPAQH